MGCGRDSGNDWMDKKKVVLEGLLSGNQCRLVGMNDVRLSKRLAARLDEWND